MGYECSKPWKFLIWLLLFQVGVIRPISRDSDGAKQQDFNNHRDLKLKKDELKENKTSPIHVNKNNKVSGSKENNDQRKKETLIIEKDPVFVPVESSRENTQVFNQTNSDRRLYNPLLFLEQELHKQENTFLWWYRSPTEWSPDCDIDQ